MERLGLDENYVDVTSLVSSRSKEAKSPFVGHVYGGAENHCDCGCFERLSAGSAVAQELRDAIAREFNLKTCAGIAHNKLLAKLVGSVHKPDQQTTLFPNDAHALLCNLDGVGKIPWIGKGTEEILRRNNIRTVSDLLDYDYGNLKLILGDDRAAQVLDLCRGVDSSIVKTSGRPLSIGLEDSCRPLSAAGEISNKLEHLLSRLMVLVGEDGRTPRAIKLTIRKHTSNVNLGQRESRQCNIVPSLFKVRNVVELKQQSYQSLMATVMRLFNKMVNVNGPFRITLLGLSFVKFVDRMNGRSSISSFLVKNVEVQSVTNIENKKTCEAMDLPSDRQSETNNTDGSESDFEPSPKKTKLMAVAVKRRCLETDDCPSPSKLKVAELNLSSRNGNVSHTPTKSSGRDADVRCPPDTDPTVFDQLPEDIRREIWSDYQARSRPVGWGNSTKKNRSNTLFNYFRRD